jgi:hypothetical protein
MKGRCEGSQGREPSQVHPAVSAVSLNNEDCEKAYVLVNMANTCLHLTRVETWSCNETMHSDACMTTPWIQLDKLQYMHKRTDTFRASTMHKHASALKEQKCIDTTRPTR